MDVGQIMMQLMPADIGAAAVPAVDGGQAASGMERLFGALLGDLLLDVQAADMSAVADAEALEGSIEADMELQQPDPGAANDAISQMMAQLSAYQAILAMSAETVQVNPALSSEAGDAGVSVPVAVDGLVAVPADEVVGALVASVDQQSVFIQAADVAVHELPAGDKQAAFMVSHEPKKVVTRQEVHSDAAEQFIGQPNAVKDGAAAVQVQATGTQRPERAPVDQEQLPGWSVEPQRMQSRGLQSGDKPVDSTAAAGDVQRQDVVQATLVKSDTGPVTEARKSEQIRFAQPADVAAAVDAGHQGALSADATQDDGQPSPDLADTAEQLVEKTLPEAAQGRHTSTANIEHFQVTSPAQQQSLDELPDEVRLALPEQVSRRVSEHLSQHELRQGQDQISLKLSPEHLGNLQVHLRMEDQRLKLEIVAENRGVRDALLQQADDLRESLSRQNIRMDAFDVTTGTGSNLSQQSQGWRRMAAEYQPYTSRYNGGSAERGLVAGAQASMQYFAPQYQSTIDVRF